VVFGVFLSEGLLENLTQIICYIAKRKQKSHNRVKAM